MLGIEQRIEPQAQRAQRLDVAGLEQQQLTAFDRVVAARDTHLVPALAVDRAQRQFVDQTSPWISAVWQSARSCARMNSS